MTLQDFIKLKGSQEKAAHHIGISFATLNRILNGHHHPSQLLLSKLKSMDIEFNPNDIKMWLTKKDKMV